jgi:hypothetical protein
MESDYHRDVKRSIKHEIITYVSKLRLEKAQLNLIMVLITNHNHLNIGVGL